MTAPTRKPHLTADGQPTVWEKLSAPVPTSAIAWRQDGKVTQRQSDGKYFARWVAYIEANTVRERLDSVVPGEWDLTLELMPPLASQADVEGQECAFKARLQILGVLREDVGVGRDYKQASTDAFKRAAVRFGIGHELYDYEQNWVEMDGDGKYAKPVEDPNVAYERRWGKRTVPSKPATDAHPLPKQIDPLQAPAGGSPTPTDMEVVACPKCGGRMWDNRLTKRNPRAPDYKCQNRSCDGVVWPPKAPSPTGTSQADNMELVGGTDDDLPF